MLFSVVFCCATYCKERVCVYSTPPSLVASSPFAAMPLPCRHEEPGCTQPLVWAALALDQVLGVFHTKLDGTPRPSKVPSGGSQAQDSTGICHLQTMWDIYYSSTEEASPTQRGAEDHCCCSLEATLAHQLSSAKSRRLPAVKALAAGSEAARRGRRVSQHHQPTAGRRCQVLIGELRQAAFYSQVTPTMATLRRRLTSQPQRSDTRATTGGMTISAGT